MSRDSLVAKAREAMERAYAPYSGFRVGAALLAEDGSIHTGCNVENASYGLTVCAERVAIFGGIAAGARTFVALAVSMGSETKTPGDRMPCGACRQVMTEFMPNDAAILIGGLEVFRLEQLLPHPFLLSTSG